MNMKLKAEIKYNGINIPSNSCPTAGMLTAVTIKRFFQINVFAGSDDWQSIYTAISVNEFPCNHLCL